MVFFDRVVAVFVERCMGFGVTDLDWEAFHTTSYFPSLRHGWHTISIGKSLVLRTSYSLHSGRPEGLKVNSWLVSRREYSVNLVLLLHFLHCMVVYGGLMS